MKEVFYVYQKLQMKNIIIGMKAYLGAFHLISRLKLWKFFIVPMVISVVVAIVIAAFAYGLSDAIGDYIASLWQWDSGREMFTLLSTFISALLIIAIGLVLYKHTIMALSAPFMSPVSEKIECYFMGHTAQQRSTSFKEQLIRGLRVNFRNLFREIFFTLPILLLGFIPVLGFLSTLLLFVVQAYYAGFGNMDYTLERHFTYRESITFVKQHKGLAIGNGIVFMLFLLIPVIGVILVLPLSVTAATMTTIEKIHQKPAIE